MQSQRIVMGVLSVMPISMTASARLMLCMAGRHSMPTSSGNAPAQSQEVPGQKSPATRCCSIAAGVLVGRHGQGIYLGPLHLQPAVIHHAASVPRVGIPAPVQQSQKGCLQSWETSTQQNLHKQQGVGSLGMACVRGSREAKSVFRKCCQHDANISSITTDFSHALTGVLACCDGPLQR